MKRLAFIFVLFVCLPVWAAEVMPPKPEHYFNDYAHIVSPATASRLNQQLEDFEKQTSSQIVVAIYPKMQSDSAIEDYAVRVYRAWQIGLKSKNNGALMLVYVQDRKMNITTGYGLEGALPDAICKRIIADEITPHFQQGDFSAGMSAGVTAMMAAAKGEYKGTGRTVDQGNQRGQRGQVSHSNLWLIVVVIMVILIFSSRRRGMAGMAAGWMLGSGGFGGWSGGGGGGGGWSGGGGGGGFSGGGGSSGGGGASGSW